MKAVSSHVVKLVSGLCLIAAAGCASTDAPVKNAGNEPGRLQAEEKYAYTGSRIATRNSAGHVVQVNGTDYLRSLPNNPGTALMAGQKTSGQ